MLHFYIPKILHSSQILKRGDYQVDVVLTSDFRPKGGGYLNIWI